RPVSISCFIFESPSPPCAHDYNTTRANRRHTTNVYRPEVWVAKARCFCDVRTLMRFLACAFLLSATFTLHAEIGIFEGHGNIGPANVGGAGVDYNDATKTYKISGTGSNMWFSADAFHFVWKKVSGDVSLTSAIEIPPSSGGDPHRKAVLMIRQSLDADS